MSRERQRITLYLDQEAARRLRDQADREGRSLNAVLRDRLAEPLPLPHRKPQAASRNASGPPRAMIRAPPPVVPSNP